MKKNIHRKFWLLSLFLLFSVLVSNVHAQSPGRDNAPSRDDRREWSGYSGTEYTSCKKTGEEWHQTQHCGWDEDGHMKYGLFSVKSCTCITWEKGRKGKGYSCKREEFKNQCYN